MTHQIAPTPPQRPDAGPRDVRLDVLTALTYALAGLVAAYCIGWFMLPQLSDSGVPEVPRRYQTPVWLALLAMVPPVVPLLARSTPGSKPVRVVALTEAVVLSTLALTVTAILTPFSSLPLEQ